MENQHINQENEEINQEELAQKALGNTTAEEHHEEIDLLSTPKTSGTGSNHSVPTPHSLIVHEDKEGEDRYENGQDKGVK